MSLRIVFLPSLVIILLIASELEPGTENNLAPRRIERGAHFPILLVGDVLQSGSDREAMSKGHAGPQIKDIEAGKFAVRDVGIGPVARAQAVLCRPGAPHDLRPGLPAAARQIAETARTEAWCHTGERQVQPRVGTVGLRVVHPHAETIAERVPSVELITLDRGAANVLILQDRELAWIAHTVEIRVPEWQTVEQAGG